MASVIKWFSWKLSVRMALFADSCKKFLEINFDDCVLVWNFFVSLLHTNSFYFFLNILFWPIFPIKSKI